MDEESAFLDHIVEKHDDDVPRLVYADWLQEHGQEDRAELIRVQCQLADPTLDPKKVERLRGQEYGLLYNRSPDRFVPVRTLTRRVLPGDRWYGELYRWPVPGFVDPITPQISLEFHRGFPEHFACGPVVFRENAEEIFRTAPTLHSLLLRGEDAFSTTEEMARLAQCDHLSRLNELRVNVTGNYEEEISALGLAESNAARIAVLLASPHLGGIERLIVAQQAPFGAARSGTGDPIAHAIASSKVLRPRVLNLEYDDISGAGVRALAESGSLDKVEELILNGNLIGDEGALAIAAAAPPGLRRISVMGCGIGRQGFRALAGIPSLLELIRFPEETGYFTGRAIDRVLTQHHREHQLPRPNDRSFKIS